MTTKMLQETLESASILSDQWQNNTSLRNDLSKFIQSFDPYSFITVARGSSDHATQYFSYLAALRLEKFSTSFTPSLATLYKKTPKCNQSLSIAISQSGKSPDLIQSMESLKKNGSPTLCLTNNASSPLAKICDHIYPLHAKEELSVAATKSYIASLFACAGLIASAKEDKVLLKALPSISETLNKTNLNPWPEMSLALKESKRAMVLGRGPGFAVALEAALKFKETCNLQAEAFSAAEIKHGPQAVVNSGYPLIVFALRGPTQASLLAIADEMRLRGALVLTITDQPTGTNEFGYTPTKHEDLDALSAIYNFYFMVEELSRLRGLDPDNPPSLSKVTLTL